jgi:hypothetical protein
VEHKRLPAALLKSEEGCFLRRRLLSRSRGRHGEPKHKLLRKQHAEPKLELTLKPAPEPKLPLKSERVLPPEPEPKLLQLNLGPA